MSSTSEQTFTARLRRAQDLAQYIAKFENYKPPRAEETVDSFGALVAEIATFNDRETTHEQAYKFAVSRRTEAFRGNDSSIIKILPKIAGAVQSQYGKKSRELKTVTAIISRMRDAKVYKTPADPDTNTAASEVSKSALSYGSVFGAFNELIANLCGFSGYNPSNGDLQIKALQAKTAEINTMNNDVARTFQELKAARTRRNELYTDLQDRVQRIKAYVKSEYGVNSEEFKLIKGLKI